MSIQIPDGENITELSVALTERDVRDLEFIRRSPERLNALHAVAPQAVSREELAHAVFEAGLESIKGAALEKGYEQLASSAEYKDEVAKRRANRTLVRRPASADDQ